MSEVNLKVTLDDSEQDDEQLQALALQFCQEITDIAGVASAGLIPITTAEPNAKGIGGFLANMFQAVVTSEVVVNVVGTLAELNAGRKVTVELERTVGESTKRINIKVGSPKDLEQVVPQVRQLLED
ncbi:MAG: hypothetical protein F6J87_30280 [Spirulina sp. SIO3F2]|nr:hypothetical protein [Spirulina sp. SIO3F2]